MKEVLPGGKYPVGHYVPGIISKGMVYVSGQLPIDFETGKLGGDDLETQMKTAMKNVERILNEAGCGFDQMVQCRIYIPDVAYWDEVNRIYKSIVGEHRAARVVVPTTALHHGALVEIEAVAELEE